MGVSRDVASARSVEELARLERAGAHPRYLFFWGHQSRPDGRLDAACLSQWWPIRFAAEGQQFGSAEHFMMWRKAVLFGDTARAAAILKARSPAKAKALGREVEHFDQVTWDEHRWEIVVSASIAKFGGDPELLDFLRNTGKRVLVEASPVDRIWGIGLGADSPFADVPQRWKGLNLLGFALMEARAQLAKT